MIPPGPPRVIDIDQISVEKLKRQRPLQRDHWTKAVLISPASEVMYQSKRHANVKATQRDIDERETIMTEASKELGVMAVLAKRMVEERLPKALALKERIDRGEKLNELDLLFLEQVVKDANQIRPVLKDDARAMKVAAQVLQLYREISEKALQNEQGAAKS